MVQHALRSSPPRCEASACLEAYRSGWGRRPGDRCLGLEAPDSSETVIGVLGPAISDAQV